MTLTTHHRQTQRKSLKQCLKDLLQRHRLQTYLLPRTVGSGILRKADQSATCLPEISKISLFPDFESSRFDIDSYSVSIPSHFGAPISEGDRSSISRHSLLPQTRLSQFNLNHSYVKEGKSLHVTYLESVPEIFHEGASRQASLVSLQSIQLRPSRSALRIRKSTQSFGDQRWSQSSRSSNSRSLTPVTPPRNQFQTLSEEVDKYPTKPSPTRSPNRLGRTRSDISKQPIPKICLSPAEGSKELWAQQDYQSFHPWSPPTSSIRHFGSFCVLDTYAPGCPITATSEDLRYVFDVGEEFFLNNQECKDTSMDIVTGLDTAGNEVTHLVLFSPLISPSSGRSRFMLAALIDVTHFIQDAAAVPELDTISEESAIESEVSTPVSCKPVPRLWSRPSYELSCEDLLGGCFIDGIKNPSQSIRSGQDIRPAHSPNNPRFEPSPLLDDIWMDLAQEARSAQLSSTSSSRSVTPRSAGQGSSPSSSTISAVDDVLESFMCDLKQLYSNFFLLAKSPLDDDFYEICNVSPGVYVGKDYVQGHLSHSSAETVAGLSEKLGGSVAFSMHVRWGIIGEEKGLYCIPLFGQRSITWTCMLVDLKLGPLWEEE